MRPGTHEAAKHSERRSRAGLARPVSFQPNLGRKLTANASGGRNEMKVSEALQSNRQVLATCIPEESVVSFATQLDTLRIGAMPVSGPDGSLVGVISERDIVRGFVRDGARLLERRVRDLMTRDVVTCGPETSLSDAEKLMAKHRIRHLPVVDGGKVVGMLSIRDVMAWRLRESRDEVNVLREAMIATRHT